MKRFGLSVNERIKRKKDFELIFSAGSPIYSKKKLLKAIYAVELTDTAVQIKIAAVAGKKLGNAVWRNRVKRLIKESYRLNKEILSETCLRKNISLKIIFSPFALNQNKYRSLFLKDLMPEVIELMTIIKNRI